MKQSHGKLLESKMYISKYDKELYGVLDDLETGKEMHFIVERELLSIYDFDTISINDYFSIAGELSVVDDDLWVLFKDRVDWKQPPEIIFVKDFSINTVNNVFLF